MLPFFYSHMKAKTPLDIAFQSIETESTFQNISCLCFLENSIENENLIALIDERSKLFPRMQYRLGNENEKYFTENFSKDFQKYKTLTGEDGLIAYLNQLSTPFKSDSPTWGVFTTKSPNLIAFILNHALGDGVSGLEFFHSLTSVHAENRNRAIHHNKKIRYLGAIKHLLKEMLGNADHVGINGSNSKDRELLLLSMPYSKIQKLKKEYSTTAYPILLALVANTMNHYCSIQVKGQVLRPLLPVSIRGKNNVTDLSNEIGGATIGLPLGIKNFKELVELIQNELTSTLTKDAYFAYYLWASFLALLPTKFRRLLSKMSAHRTSFICTNLVGPNSSFDILGNKVLEQYVIPALMPGHGLGFGFMKSSGRIQISIIYDPVIIKDGPKLHHSLENALRDIGITEDFKIRNSEKNGPGGT